VVRSNVLVGTYRTFTSNTREARWNSMFELLCRYREEHGDCLVPQKHFMEGLPLGGWVKSQREQYKRIQEGRPCQPNPKEAFERLEDIGFVWYAREARWNAMFDCLCRYKEEKGDCHVPQNHSMDNNMKLGAWVSTQRREYHNLREGKSSTINPEQIARLTNIGLDWNPLETLWNERFLLLCQYKEEHGHCLVPRCYVMGDIHLGSWATHQRQEYRKLEKTEPSKIVQERMRRLESIGFDFDPFGTQWNAMFDRLCEYKKEKGDFLVPKGYTVDNINLCAWVSNQRRDYHRRKGGKPSAMTTERIKELESINFDFNPFETQWNARFTLLCEYRKENNNCLVPLKFVVGDVNLGAWIDTQRQEYRKLREGFPSAMTTERITKLDSVGFVWRCSHVTH